MPKILWLYFRDGHIQTYLVDDIVIDYDKDSVGALFVEYIIHNGTTKRRAYFNDLNKIDIKDPKRKLREDDNPNLVGVQLK